jgi:excisionase family DNA binding protein
MKSKDFLSVPEAASLLGCSDVWVIRMVRAGGLDGFKLSGRAWAISRKSVEKSIEEYQQRDPSRAGRKREGAHLAPQKRKQKSPATDSAEAGKVTGYYSGTQAAKFLGCSVNTISRAARKAGVGIWLIGGRLAALSPADVEALKAHIHETSGNPNWIATRGQGKNSRFRKG